MISGPRTSWKTSSKRRSRPSGTNSGSFNAGEIKQNTAKKYEQQLNPYKSSLRDSHNGHKSPHGNSATRGVTDDQDNFRDSDIDLGASDEEFGIDDILKDIDNDDIDENEAKPPAAAASTKVKVDSESNKHQSDEKEAVSKQVQPIVDYMPQRKVKQNAAMKSTARKVAPVDFGDSKQEKDRSRIGREIPRHRDMRNRELDDVHTTTEEDNDTLLNDSFSDGDATKEHKMLVQTGQTPIFSSGGFDGDNKSRRRSLSNPSLAEMQDTMRKSNQMMDELLDDIDNDYNNLLLDKSDGTISTRSTPDSADRALRNLVNDYASSMDKGCCLSGLRDVNVLLANALHGRVGPVQYRVR